MNDERLRQLKEAYNAGWSDAGNYYCPDMGMFLGPNSPGEGWKRYRASLTLETKKHEPQTRS